MVTLDERVARWARQPIPTGHPEFALRPLVVGPGEVPLIVEPAVARLMPELAVLSALVHASGAQALPVARAALEASSTLDAPRADLYADLVFWALSESAPQILEALMNPHYEYKSEFARHYYGKGREEGREEGHLEGARRLLRQLAVRFGDLPPWVEPLVLEASSDQLDRWAEGIFSAPSLEGLLGRAS